MAEGVARWRCIGRALFSRRAALAWLTLVIVVVRFVVVEPFSSLRSAFFDLEQRLFLAMRIDAPVTIVEIDEVSLTELGQWPWPRTHLANMVNHLAEWGARAVSFAVILAEPDRLSPENLQLGLPTDSPVRNALSALPSHDDVLAASLARVPAVLSLAVVPVGSRGAGGVPSATNMVLRIDGAIDLGANRYPALLRNLERLEKASRGAGVISIKPSRDGVVRHLPSLAQVNGAVFPAFAVETIRVAAGNPVLAVEGGPRGVYALHIGDRAIDAGADGKVWLRFAPNRSIPRISAADVAGGRLDSSLVRDRVVLVGTTAAGLGGRYMVPTGERLSGVELQAQFVANLMAGTTLKRPDWMRAAESVAAVLAGLFVLAIARMLGNYRGQLAVFAVAGAMAGIAFYAYAAHGVLVDPTYALAVTVAVYVAVVAHEIVAAHNARRQSEHDRERAIVFAEAANRTRSYFLANMSHELRTPLTAIMGYSEMMTRGVLGPVMPERYREYAADIHRTGGQLLVMVEQILGLVEAKAGNLRLVEADFSILAAVRSCLGRLEPEMGAHAVTLEEVDRWPNLRGDRLIFMQMVMNLLSNALKFSPPDGGIRIACAMADRGELRLTVTDNGPGIAEDIAAEVFNPFRDTPAGSVASFEGVGLGLPLTKVMIELHGGRVELAKGSAGGTAATLIFPARRVRPGSGETRQSDTMKPDLMKPDMMKPDMMKAE